MFRFTVILAVLACHSTATAHAGLAAQQQQAPPASAGAMPQYADSVAGLKQMLADLVALKSAGKDAELDARLAALVLPEYRDWFARHFGESRGAEFAEAYSRIADNLPQMLRNGISELAAAGDDWQVETAQPILWKISAADAEAKPHYVRVHQTLRLYHVRFGKPARAIRYFVRDDGGFRYAGGLNSIKRDAAPAPPPDPAAPRKIKRVRVGGNVQQARLLEQPRPVYPQAAKDARVQGTVRLQAIVGKDGRILELEVVAGPPELIIATLVAVAQWRYAPTLLNGEPIEVVTMIDVVYSLS